MYVKCGNAQGLCDIIFMQIATVGGMSSEMQLDEEEPSTAGFSWDKQQQNGQPQQTGFQSAGFSAAIPITAQAGVIDGMEE